MSFGGAFGFGYSGTSARGVGMPIPMLPQSNTADTGLRFNMAAGPAMFRPGEPLGQSPPRMKKVTRVRQEFPESWIWTEVLSRYTATLWFHGLRSPSLNGFAFIQGLSQWKIGDRSSSIALVVIVVMGISMVTAQICVLGTNKCFNGY